MKQKKHYCAPDTQIIRVAFEHYFLAQSATVSNITPGDDPVVGGSWYFGDND